MILQEGIKTCVHHIAPFTSIIMEY